MKKVVCADLSDYGPLAAEEQGALAAVTDPHYYYDGPTYRFGRVSCPFIAAIIRLRFGDGGSNGAEAEERFDGYWTSCQTTPKPSPSGARQSSRVVVQGICQGILFRDYVSSVLL